MRLHTNLYSRDVREALDRAKASGRVDRLVDFLLLEPKKSRKRENGFEVRLEWLGEKVKGDGRRWANSGKYGAESYSNGNGYYAATWDEWGWFIAELYRADPSLVFGHYTSREVFDSVTKYKFA